jgi:hypothetical protein
MSSTFFDGLYDEFLTRRWFPAATGPVPPPQIVVLGAGVIGLSTALAVKCRYPHAAVTVLAEDFVTPVSAVAAAVWFPLMSVYPRTAALARETYERLSEFLEEVQTVSGRSQSYTELAATGEAHSANPIQYIQGWTLAEQPNYVFSQIPSYVRKTALDPNVLPHPFWKSGLEWRSKLV